MTHVSCCNFMIVNMCGSFVSYPELFSMCQKSVTLLGLPYLMNVDIVLGLLRNFAVIDVTRCHVVEVCQCFGGMYFIHFQTL
jgi:hypothetical protein